MKELASLSLDLDNKWSYMKTHGDNGWETFPSYLDVVVPRTLEFLEERDLKITFFIVGQDAALQKNHDALRAIAEAGHEIGNHSFNHEPWLHLYTKQELIDELSRAEDAIGDATGRRTLGFRGPGFSLTATVLDCLVERGYEYDCSTLPTFIAPLARAYYFLSSPEMTVEEKQKRQKLFGNFSDGFAPIRPHMVAAAGKTLVEVPVTTFPLVKTPVHVSYLVYLATFSKAAAVSYWRLALAACRAAGIGPSLLLHPLDLMCGEDADELKFFPGMAMQLERKLEILDEVLSLYQSAFHVVPVGEHAVAVRRSEHASRSQICR